MKIAAFALLSLLIASCDKPTELDLKRLDSLQMDAAVTDAQRYLGEGGKIAAVCGASEGVFISGTEDGFSIESDRITDGVIALAFDRDGKPDIVHRDVEKTMQRMSEEQDTEVIFTPNPNDDRLGNWTVRFKSSGIVETHTLVRDEAGTVFDLWASPRPKNLVVPARMVAFAAKCELVP